MKKLRILLLILLVVPAVCKAQVDENLFPKAGTMSIGVDLGYFMKGIHNLTFGNGTNDNIVRSYGSDIFLRYYLKDNLALRARLDIGVNNTTDRLYVRDDFAFMNDPMSMDPQAVTVDTRKVKNTDLGIGIGLEYRYNLWRIQGYAGGEVFLGTGIRNANFEYGNEITAANQTPSTANFNDNFVVAHPSGPSANLIYDGYRVLKYNSRNTFTCGLGAFIGADFFICKNISIGPEFYLGAAYTAIGESNAITEKWNANTNSVFTGEQPIYPRSSSFGIAPKGYINLMFHF